MPKSAPVTPSKQQPDYNELVSEFVQKAGRGLPKTFIRKLWAVEEDLLENANPSTLRMMYCAPALLICKEGVQLLAVILVKIGVVSGLTLLEKQILKSDLTDTDCQRYGEVFATAWVNAHSDANFDLTEELETDVFHSFFQHALFGHKPLCTKFQKVLSAFAVRRKDQKDLAKMTAGILNGCIFRALDSKNSVVQSSGAEVFFLFFPFVCEEEKADEMVEKQLDYMYDLVRSEIVHIRTSALKSTLKALSQYWVLLNKQKAKAIASYIIDTLARDSVVGVRVAIFEGLISIAYEPQCLSIYQHGMKICTTAGVQDKSERVRLVVHQALCGLKTHKFITLFDVHDRDDIVSMMELENVEDCRRQLVPIMQGVLPVSEGLDERYYRPRVDSLLAKSRLATLTYFRLLGPMKIIKPPQAAQLIEMLIMWAYRILRCKDSQPLSESDSKYQKARSYLECALILYMSCKKMLLFDCDGKVKARCDQWFGKVTTEIFENYCNTRILGTATAISSVIPKDYLKPIASDVLARLADDDVPTEAVEPFLESALHFNPESIFNSISDGLEVLVDLYGEKKKQSKKKKHDVGVSEEDLTTALNRLLYILQTHSTSSLLATDDMYKTKILEMVKKIDYVRIAIEKRLEKEEDGDQVLRDETLLLVLEFRFILPIYAVSENHDEDERKSIIKSIKDLLYWFRDNICEKMKDVAEHNKEFLINMSIKVFDCLNVALSAYDFKTRPLEYEDEEDQENRSPEEKEQEKEEETTVAEIASEVVKSFCNSLTPLEIFAPALRVGATLCEESYSEVHHEMASLLRFMPKWLNKQYTAEDGVVPTEQQEKEIVEALRQFHKKVSETDMWDEDMSAAMVYHFAVFTLLSISTDEELEDPRQEEYDPPRFVSLALLKFVLRDRILTGDFLNELSKNYLPEDSKFFTVDTEEGLTTNKKLEKLALLSHFLRILERYSRTHSNVIKDAIQTCKTRVLDCYESAKDLDTVERHVLNSLSALLDVSEPDDC